MEQFSEVFFTKGVGRCKKTKSGRGSELLSFERALKDADIAPYNWVTVNSIFPAYGSIITREEGVRYLKGKEGYQVFYVCSRQSSCIDGEMEAAIGLAKPKDRSLYGYLSEIHYEGSNNSTLTIGERAEDLASVMLAELYGFSVKNDDWTGLRNDFNSVVPNVDITTLSNSIKVETSKDYWTTVISCAVLLP